MDQISFIVLVEVMVKSYVPSLEG